MQTSTRLRALLDQEGTVTTVAAHDSLTARIVDRKGAFDALLLPGSGAAMSHLGLPDVGLLSMPEMANHAKHVQACVQSPLIVDVDDGYGGPESVVRTVREFARTGVGGLLLEDQDRPKRHGYDADKRVLSREEALTKVRTAVGVRDDSASDLVLVARTGALGAVDGSVEEAIDRANAFRDAGADAVYVQGPQTMAQVRRIAEDVDAPQLYEGAGSSPRLTEAEARDLGYDILHFARGVTYATAVAVDEYAADLADEGLPALERRDEAFHDRFDDLQAFMGRDEFAAAVRDRE